MKFASLLLVALLSGVAAMQATTPATGLATPCPMNPEIIGYQSFGLLKEALESAVVSKKDYDNRDEQVFVICPHTTLSTTSSIQLDYRYVGVVIQCGSLGSPNDKCVVDGGVRQFNVMGAGATFRGVTFKGSSSAVFVDTAGLPFRPMDSTRFESCIFEENVQPDPSPVAPAVTIRGLPFSDERTFFENCIFRGNKSHYGPVWIHYFAVAYFDGCLFENNQCATGWNCYSYSVTSAGHIEISKSDFGYLYVQPQASGIRTYFGALQYELRIYRLGKAADLLRKIAADPMSFMLDFIFEKPEDLGAMTITKHITKGIIEDTYVLAKIAGPYFRTVIVSEELVGAVLS